MQSNSNKQSAPEDEDYEKQSLLVYEEPAPTTIKQKRPPREPTREFPDESIEVLPL